MAPRATDGLTPAERRPAMQRAKQTAFHVTRAVQERDAHMLQRISDGLERAEVWALLILVAEVADLIKLKHVKDVPDNGMPPDAVKLKGAA